MKPTIQQQLKKLKFFGVRLRSRSKRVSVYRTKRVRVGNRRRGPYSVRLRNVRVGSRVNRWFGTKLVALRHDERHSDWTAVVIDSALEEQLESYWFDARTPQDALRKLERSVRKELRLKIRQLERWLRTRAAYGTVRYDRVAYPSRRRRRPRRRKG